MDKTTSYPTAQHREGHLAWDCIPKDSAIKKWVGELAQLTADSARVAAWDMVGHAVLLETDDAEVVREVMYHVADDARMQLRIIDCDQIIADFSQWLDSLTLDVPSIVYLTPGQWMGGESDEDAPERTRDPQDEDKSQAFRRQLADVWGCKKFCVNGLLAGNCCLAWSNDDRREESVTHRTHRRAAGELQEA